MIKYYCQINIYVEVDYMAKSNQHKMIKENYKNKELYYAKKILEMTRIG